MKDLFYKPVKISAKDEDILVWGCTHFNHSCEAWAEPIWKQRGYDSLEKHDLGLITNWNVKASDQTVGFILGDVIFGKDGEKNLLHILNRLTFKELFLLPGNHTSGWKQVFSSCAENVLDLGHKKVIFVPNYLECFVNGKSVVMSHYPILSWNGQAKGSYMLFSHVHGHLEESVLGKAYLETKCRALEMSVEKWASPPTFGDIRRVLESRTPVTFDHHTANTQNPF